MAYKHQYKKRLNEEQERYVLNNYKSFSAREMAEALGIKIYAVREQLYCLGIKKLELEYWNEEQIQFLKDNFQKIGDKELAQIFEQRWPKNKPWTLKHIEKKRKYLGLKRTKAETFAIHHRNKANGSWQDAHKWMWQTRGVSEIGDTREWPDQQGTKRKYIRTEAGFVPMAKHVWEQAHGPMPERHLIRFKDGNPLNCQLENLEAISLEENGRRNAEIASKGLSDNYVVAISTWGAAHLREEIKKQPDLIDLMRQHILLKRELKQAKTK